MAAISAHLGPGRLVAAAYDVLSAKVIDVDYPAGAEYDTHEHEDAYVCLPVHGGYREWSAGGSSRVVDAGQDVIYAQGSRHAVRVSSRGLRMVHVTDPSATGWTGSVSRRAPGILWQIAGALAGGAVGDAEALCMATLVDELRPVPGDDTDRGSWLHLVRDRLRDGYREAMSLSELAREAGRHPAHLARAFKARWGLSAGEYLRRVRVAEAIRRLRHTDDSPTTVALEVGFADQSHLTRWMRRYGGVTPGGVRARTLSAGDPALPDRPRRRRIQ